LRRTSTPAAPTLKGSASSDANGDALTYAWTLTGRPTGSAAALTGATGAMPTFFADVAGTYVASVVVNDGRVNSTAATVSVTVTVANAAPVANAGVAQNVNTGSTVTLNGSASSDANGDALTYAWTLTGRPTGSAAALTGATGAMPTFVADVAGTYVVSLVVNDGRVNSTAATVTVQAAMPSIQLYSVSTGLLGGSETLQSLPYANVAKISSSSTCVGGGCPTDYTVDTFRPVASGSSYTISNLSAVNQTTGSTILPSFSGISSNLVITAGASVTFRLKSAFTGNSSVNLRYQFRILETGQTFSYSVQLRTN